MIGDVINEDGFKMVRRSYLKTMQLFYFVTIAPEGNDSRFKRLAYQLIDGKEPVLILIQYTGDHTIAVDFPHGNRKDSNVRHVRTCPSVLKEVSHINDIPSNVYKKQISGNVCDPCLQLVLKPRNCKQVSNIQVKQRQTFRLTHDALYNVHELASMGLLLK